MAITKTVNLDVKSNLDESTKSVGSLKAQLRQAQAEVAALSDKFGATSKQAVEAAKRASELKDRIGDAKALTDAFNPDAKFAALSSSLAGVAGGFSAVTGAIGLLGVESKQVEEQILKVQSAMAIASGLQQLGESADAFKQMKAVAIDAFKGIKAAIGSTGIGLFVVALGTIYEYWDDIKEAVSGVSEQQLRLNDISQRNVDQAEEKLKTITAQDNILKLQGKSEKEILAIKIKQTDEAITATKINIENQKTTNKLAEIGAKRNYEMLKSYIDFISAPVRFLYETATSAINKIINTINKIPGIDIKANIDEKFGDKAAEYISKLGFDPEKVKSEGDATVKASQDTLNRLLNDRAGYVLASQAIDKQGLDKPKSEDDKTTKKETEKLERVEELTSLKTHEDEKFKIIQDGLTRKAQAEKNNSDASIAIAAAEKEARLKLLGEISNGLSLAAGELGAATAEGKAAAVAAATISTYTAIAGQLQAFSKIPIPGYAIAQAIVTGVTGLLQVKKILQVKVPEGGGSGGGSAPSMAGVSAPAAPSFNVVGAGGTNQLAQVMNNQGMPPVQAYVVASNVTSAQSLNRNIVNNATLG